MDRQRFIDDSARCPRGRLAQEGYGGASGAPPGHEEVFDLLLARVGPVTGERVLDVGCGGGRLLERLLQLGAAEVAGVDHSTDVLDFARRRNDDACRAGTARLSLADVRELPFSDGEFSLVVTTNAFFFFETPHTVLTEIHRVLRPGGRLVVATVPGPEPPDNVWGSAMHVYTDEELAELHLGAAFADVEVGVEDGVQLAFAGKPR
ncbi:Methyltransferase domain-containing protein [Actinopolyspora alba]|uniref:Methyltransferase domain-containing protein n=1 Tax=Actinopolyspora alba TaxID=673379 RepID=A0A1I2AZ88_9ACTN|nr:class I SAM-dependent methyltransferase [Actinopolyspora alba]SFE48323.1 Methyltransferase domain-containing protein [Actinopolyspora alba]